PEVVHDPHVTARGLLPSVDVPGVRRLQVISHPAKHSVTVTRNPAPVPRHGEHSEEILRTLGYKAREIASLAKKGVIGT
ncbi:MAG: CoA transferase, partial [Thermoplasmata archaeon]